MKTKWLYFARFLQTIYTYFIIMIMKMMTKNHRVLLDFDNYIPKNVILVIESSNSAMISMFKI